MTATYTSRHDELCAELARLVVGETEVRLDIGRADVVTKHAVFEVEPARYWRLGMMQVLAYAAELQLAPILALFGDSYLCAKADRWGYQVGIPVWIYRGEWSEPVMRRQAIRRGRHDPIIKQLRYGLRLVAS